LREAIPISTAIDELVLIWSASEAAEWTGRLVSIPLREQPKQVPTQESVLKRILRA
jgi:hypothetical protein